MTPITKAMMPFCVILLPLDEVLELESEEAVFEFSLLIGLTIGNGSAGATGLVIGGFTGGFIIGGFMGCAPGLNGDGFIIGGFMPPIPGCGMPLPTPLIIRAPQCGQ